MNKDKLTLLAVLRQASIQSLLCLVLTSSILAKTQKVATAVSLHQVNDAATQIEDNSDLANAYLRGEVSKYAEIPFTNRIDNLVEIAINQTGQKRFLDQKHHHYSKVSQRLLAWSRDLGELATEYRGVEQSSEAADVILGTKMKLKSKAAVELAKQKLADEIHQKVFSALLQMAMGLGLADIKQSSIVIEEGVAQLKQLVGEEEARKTLQQLTHWTNKQTLIPSDIFAQRPLTIFELENKSNKILSKAMDQDRVLLDIKQRLSQYNHRSKFARVSAKVLNTTLSIAALSPTIVSPAAQVAWGTFVMCNGGPEESKLLKEVYLDKRFESRWNMLNEESRLALNSYNTALITHNPALLSLSEFWLTKLSSNTTVQELLSGSTLLPAKLSDTEAEIADQSTYTVWCKY